MKRLKSNEKLTCTRGSSWAPILKRAEAARKILPTHPRKEDQEQRTREVRLLGENDVRGKAGNPQGQDVKPSGLPGKPGAQVGNPEGCVVSSSRRGKRHRDSVGLGSGKKGKKSSGSAD